MSEDLLKFTPRKDAHMECVMGTGPHCPVSTRHDDRQLEFPFMMRVSPWDGQYTFTHWIAKQCFDEAAREAKTIEEKTPLILGRSERLRYGYGRGFSTV